MFDVQGFWVGAQVAHKATDKVFAFGNTGKQYIKFLLVEIVLI
jgi:hypothetical protein